MLISHDINLTCDLVSNGLIDSGGEAVTQSMSLMEPVFVGRSFNQ